MEEILKQLAKALEENGFLTLDEKKYWEGQAKEMIPEQVRILIKVINARTPEEFNAQKDMIQIRQKELKDYTEKLITNGLNKIYKMAEDVSHNQDEDRKKVIIGDLNNI